MNTASLAIGIMSLILTVIPLFNMQSRRKTTVGSYFEFILENDRRFNIIISQISLIFFILSETVFIAGIMLFYFEPDETIANTWSMLIALDIIFFLGMALNTILNQFLSLKELKFIDELLKEHAQIDLVFASITTAVVPALFITVITACFNLQFGSLGEWIIIMMAAFCHIYVCVSFIRIYFRLRRLFVVTDVAIKEQGIAEAYGHIDNYRYENGFVILLQIKRGEVKRVAFPETKLEYIEKSIDTSTTLLKTEAQRVQHNSTNSQRPDKNNNQVDPNH